MSQGNGFGDCKCYPPSAEAANAVSFHAGGVPGLAERTAERRDRTLISGPSCPYVYRCKGVHVGDGRLLVFQVWAATFWQVSLSDSGITAGTSSLPPSILFCP